MRPRLLCGSHGFPCCRMSVTERVESWPRGAGFAVREIGTRRGEATLAAVLGRSHCPSQTTPS